MTTITLDFSSSYRAITDVDILPSLVRDPFGWDGKGAPQAAVTYIDDQGTVNTFPATNPMEGLPPFLFAHSPNSTRFDLVNLVTEAVLRFEVPVEGAPIWEDYVDALYTGSGGLNQWEDDASAYSTAYGTWVNYIMTHEFRATVAAYSDKGGILGQFTASDALIVEDFTTAPEFFAVNIRGSGFGDSVSGGELNDTLFGAAGGDKLLGEGGADFMSGGIGNDTVDGQAGSDTVNGDAGDDTLAGEVGDDRLSAGSGNDLVYGGAGNDELFGSTGNDLLHSGTGTDTVIGGIGDDLMYGDFGNDTLIGGADNDTVNGGDGKDSLTGDAGDDALSGGEGNDVLFGGDGSDFLRGGLGRDRLTGAGGSDTFLLNAVGANNADTITDFAHLSDRIGLETASFAGVHATLDAQEFRLGTVAMDGDDRILYDAASGRLYYDPDGNRNGPASAPPQMFAIIANHAALTFADFVVI